MEYMFLPLKRYAEFSGRSRRTEYWMWTLFQILLYVAVMVLGMVFAGGALMSEDPDTGMAALGGAAIMVVLYGLIWLALLVPTLAVGVRRLHDTGRTGWWILAPIVPYALLLFAPGADATSPEELAAAGGLAMIGGLLVLVLSIVLLVFMLLDGTPGPNKYGPDPKGRGNAEVFA